MEILLLGEYADRLVAALERDHEVYSVGEPDADAVVERLSGVDLIVIRSPHRITDEMLAAAPNLRWIIRAGSGTDNISPAHRDHGVEVFTTPLNSWSVAELAFGMVFALYRDLRPLHDSILDGHWEKYDASGREVYGSSIGILGFGRIGRAVTEIAASFEMDVRAFDRNPGATPKEEVATAFDVTFGDLPTVLSESDAVVVCLPLNDESHHLLDDDMLGHVKDGAVLVNVGRGAVLDLDAVYDHLTNGRLDGVGLDVYPDEPPDAHPLFELDSVVCTPHVGAQTEQARARINRRIVEIVDDLGQSSESRSG